VCVKLSANTCLCHKCTDTLRGLYANGDGAKISEYVLPDQIKADRT